MLEVWLALTSVKYLDNVLVLILLNQWLKLTMLWATQPRSLTSCFDLNAGFTRANVVVFGQSVLYWKVSVLGTETAKIVTHLNGFLQTEKVINFFSTSNFSYFETSCCSEKPNQTLFFPKQNKSFLPHTNRHTKKCCLEKISETKMKSIYIHLQIL